MRIFIVFESGNVTGVFDSEEVAIGFKKEYSELDIYTVVTIEDYGLNEKLYPSFDCDEYY